MKQVAVLIPALLLAAGLHAQSFHVTGELRTQDSKPVSGAAVSLLYPADSTLAFFGVSNSSGRFEIRSAAAGRYVLQVAGVGFRTHYAAVQVPAPNSNDLGRIMLLPVTGQLKEVEVTGEKIPVLLKGDTVEYSANAYKVKPDAVTEDLLKKLPGVEVDGAGNIKAMGKDVRKVLVDGKEFFGNDPKMATRNLPADAVSKVQVFDRKSDQAQFTGIDDGERSPTINLQLKAGKRKGVFGDVEAGGGTDERYKLSGHLYKFSTKQQVALLGMSNNINRFGFTLSDYISFRGGMRGMESGGFELDDNLPVDFGQPVTGRIRSGAGGINYTLEPRPNNRFNVSYLGNGATKRLTEDIATTSFTERGTFTRQDAVQERSTNGAHRMNFGWRNDLDSTQQLLLNGGTEWTTTATSRQLASVSRIEEQALNRLDSRVDDEGAGWSSHLSASYLKKRKGAWPVWKVSAGGTLDRSGTLTRWDNTTLFPQTGNGITDQQYRDNNTRRITWHAGTSLMRRLGRGFFLEPELRTGTHTDGINRKQGLLPATEIVIDSLSPDFSRTYQWWRPGLSFRRNTEKMQFDISVDGELGSLSSGLAGNDRNKSNYQYLLPSAHWQYAYSQGSRIHLSYRTAVEAPGATRMLPVTDYSNPVQRITGNPSLAPEYRHVGRASWLRFDQFNFTSFMAGINGYYIKDKISWSRTVRPDLSQDLTFVNVPYEYRVDGRVEYTMPVRKLGINLTAGLSEQYTQGISLINGIRNEATGFRHSLKLSASNRKKETWDIRAGGEVTINTARFSVQSSMNTRFYHYNGFAELSYRPSDRLYFSLNGILDQYNSDSFSGSVTIPLLNASASWYFLPVKRGALTLDAFDLLNRNTGLQRMGEGNYLVERQSDILRQYFMLSFKYRLNKAPKGGDGLQVEVKR